ncbi:acyl-CoA dehydrogenase family protein [Cryptosporangium aurantiacum]|uniref:Acyl-CoA dehydrogenase n=1 Tax=Cryptosporangium aurantiacum TaxID=134849 RepID=A0A1M7R4R9_9ACTN|nr:acyl-CoA dehydrogenase family protein [Cryptosporangium aurantiacum]SHN40136.1 Acyl-CoA dehydrogenase [Cryptosporangium aurantiacum]
MDLLPDVEERQIVDAIGAFLDDRLPLDRVRAHNDEPGDARPVSRAAWAGFAELGLFGLGLSEEAGGAGYGIAEELLVARELGRRLTPGPVVSTVLAAHLAAAAGNTALVAELTGDDAPAALAEPFRDPRARGGAAVSGRFLVSDRPGARYVLAVVESDFALLRAADLPPTTLVQGLDRGVRLTLADLDGARPVVHGRYPALRWRAEVLTAATSCGVAEAARDRSVAYAGTRRQFGRPIGAFQAVAHRCAEMGVRCESATAQTIYAGLVLAEGREDAAFQAAAAKLVATAAAVDNAADDVQNHGGMGFTDESGAHLFLRRARLLEHRFGAGPVHAGRLLTEPAPG